MPPPTSKAGVPRDARSSTPQNPDFQASRGPLTRFHFSWQPAGFTRPPASLARRFSEPFNLTPLPPSVNPSPKRLFQLLLPRLWR
jgi:hypothetical protein